MNAESMIVCQHFRLGFCKFGDTCRKQHINENCFEINCENINCIKRHPRNCKFYDLYKRCKFGEYCSYAHRENIQSIEITILKVKVEGLEHDINEKGNEILDLNLKVEALQQIVEDLNERVSNNMTTPTKKGNKRRKMKQHLTPSPSKEEDSEPVQHHNRDQETNLEHSEAVDSVAGEVVPDSEPDDYELTTEEILKMYEFV